MRSKASKVVSSKLLRKFGLQLGDPLNFRLEGERIIVTPRRKRKGKLKARIISDPITGYPVLYTGSDTPVLTNERVTEILANFP
jgi:hypothetical protein